MDEFRKKLLFLLLALIQLGLCLCAMFLPYLVVGEVTKKDAKEFLKGLPEKNIPGGDQIVHSSIGFILSYINGTIDVSNREGAVGIFGFIFLSALSSLFTVMYAMQLVLHCCDDICEGCCKCLSINLRKLAKSNYSSGMSGLVATAMAGFAAEDFKGANLGTNFYLQIGAIILSCVIHFSKASIKSRKWEEEDSQQTFIRLSNV